MVVARQSLGKENKVSVVSESVRWEEYCPNNVSILNITQMHTNS